MRKITKTAVKKRLNNGENEFYIGKYHYRAIDGMLYRREQEIGKTPTTTWKLVGVWNYNEAKFYLY